MPTGFSGQAHITTNLNDPGTCAANLPLSVGGADAGSMREDPTASAGSEAEALPTTSREVL